MIEQNLIEILKNYNIDDIKTVEETGQKQYEILLNSNEKYILKTLSENEKNIMDEKVEKMKSLFENNKLAPKFLYGKLSEDENFLMWKEGSPLREKSFGFGEELGKFLKTYHCEFQNRGDQWRKNFDHRIVLLLHNYYMSKHEGPKDYIILDYLNENKYLISDRKPSLLLGLEDVLNINLDDEGRLSNIDLTVEQMADPYFQFKNLNFLKSSDLDYVNGLIKGYFKDCSTILFFKTMAVYTIVEYLYDEFEGHESINHERINEKIDRILEIYNDFSDIYPHWYRK